MTSGDFWVRKKFISLLWERFLIFYVHFRLSFCYVPFLYVFLAHSLDTQSSRYIVFLFLSGDIKSIFLIYLKKFSFFAVLFSGILMMIIPKAKKSFLCLIFFLSLPLPSHILPHFINVYVFAFLRFKKISALCTLSQAPRRVYLTHPNTRKIWINDSWFTFCGFWINLHNGGWKINFIHIKCVYNSGFHSFEGKKKAEGEQQFSFVWLAFVRREK